MDEIKAPRLFNKGAEANLYLAYWYGKRVIIKKRLPKKYRPSKLDKRIRNYRTIHEPQLMHEARKAGVPTPIIFKVDTKNAMIIMEYIEGDKVKSLLSVLPKGERRNICENIGELTGRLHNYGIIHGDLTTSNMIRTSEDKIVFLDFGLGEKTKEVEARGVDLHLMKRALQSTHFFFSEECLNAVIKGYTKVLSHKTVKQVLDKIQQIENRGRYVPHRKSS